MTIEEKEDELSNRVNLKLDAIGYKIADIMSYEVQDYLRRDLTTKPSIVTSFTEMLFGESISVISDPETLEMLYVQSGPITFVEIDHFFQKLD